MDPCDVCGKPATQWMGDPWGKSDVKRPKCGEHGLRFRDPTDVAEIARLRTALQQIVDSYRDGYQTWDFWGIANNALQRVPPDSAAGEQCPE